MTTPTPEQTPNPPQIETPTATGDPPPTASEPVAAPTPSPALSADAWPENWRDRLAGEDKKALETLARFTDPTALYKSYTEMRSKLSDRSQYQRVLPKDATPEQIADYRKLAGIPEKWEDYKLELGDKTQMTESDQQIFKDFMQYAHGKNLTPEALNTAAGWYLDFQQRQTDQLAQQDLESQQVTEDRLRQEWGSDYRANLNAVANLFAGAPKEVETQLLSARGPNGVRLGNDAPLLQWLAGLARELNPAATLVPAGSDNSVITSEIEQIRQVMKNDINRYWSDQKMQDRYHELTATQNRLLQRGRA